MIVEIILITSLILFLLGIAISFKFKSSESILKIPAYISVAIFFLFVPVLHRVIVDGPFMLLNKNLLFDSLAIFHVFLVNFVFGIASILAVGYFKSHIEKHGDFEINFIRRYVILWELFQMLLLVVLISNNIGLQWVALEATTLISAFLIIQHGNSLSIEAMWKYLIVCSVGIAFAFMGVILTVAANKYGVKEPIFLFTELAKHSDHLNSKIMLVAFIFITVGFGTKAGLAPMHTWLPDAHSQSPTPVSAVFSGIMLNIAFFAILRYLPITELAMNKSGHAHSILLILGFSSLLFAMIFFPVQKDIKRLLAYSSVEHLGIIAIGIGLGGFGTFAALLHVLNNSVSKTLGFFAAGHISEQYGSRDMSKISAAVKRMPVWGTAFFVAMLALIGVAPFSIFLSEFYIIKTAFLDGHYILTGLFIFATLFIFVAALKHTLSVSYGSIDSNITIKRDGNTADKLVVMLLIGILLLFGLYIPHHFSHFLKEAASAIENGIIL